MGIFQRCILWAAGLCFVADCMEILLLSLLTVLLRQDWQLTETQTSTITFPSLPVLRQLPFRLCRCPLGKLNAGATGWFGWKATCLYACRNHYILFRTLHGAGEFLRFSTLNEISHWIWFRWAYSPFWYVFMLLLVCVEMYFVLATSVKCPQLVCWHFYFTLFLLFTQKDMLSEFLPASHRGVNL
jgi:hypothetical protein